MSGAHVVVVGAGGNIGSHLVPHLGRMPEVSRVTLVDRDTYEATNMAGQDITAREVGRPKAVVQAARLRRINPALRVVAWPQGVEALPLGALRADVIVACLDSRVARQQVNESAWHLGTRWIDAGVEGGQLLARVSIYTPAATAPCLECAWDDHDYAALEQQYPCEGDRRARPTNAPSSLGAFAAALQAIECRKLLTGSPVAAVAGRQVLFDLAHHKSYVTAFRRRPACRFVDHTPWTVETLPAHPRDLSIAAALDLAGNGHGLSVAGARLILRSICTTCGLDRAGFRFVRPAAGRCPRCGGRLVTPGTEIREELTPDMLPGRRAQRSLASVGVRRQDIVSVRTADAVVHYEIDGERR